MFYHYGDYQFIVADNVAIIPSLPQIPQKYQMNNTESIRALSPSFGVEVLPAFKTFPLLLRGYEESGDNDVIGDVIRDFTGDALEVDPSSDSDESLSCFVLF